VNTPGDVRSKIAHHTGRFSANEAQADKSVTWEVIHDMENAWRDRPVKERTSNRRAVLMYLFGLDSTKSMTHAQILAVRQWMRLSPDREAELHAVLEARLVEAGQGHLPLPPMAPEQRKRDLAALFPYDEELAR
jgi:hypothetical protein